jgi:nucleotide-binding universal stress UspA family protein
VTIEPMTVRAPRGTIGYDDMGAFRRILVPIDFSPGSMIALDVAADLARDLEAWITLVHVLEWSPEEEMRLPDDPGRIVAEETDRALRRLDALAAERRPRAHFTDVHVRNGLVWQEIMLEAIESNADVIVMGKHSRRGFQAVARALLGTVTDSVIRNCPLPVLVVHDAQAGVPGAPRGMTPGRAGPEA